MKRRVFWASWVGTAMCAATTAACLSSNGEGAEVRVPDRPRALGTPSSGSALGLSTRPPPAWKLERESLGAGMSVVVEGDCGAMLPSAIEGGIFVSAGRSFLKIEGSRAVKDPKGLPLAPPESTHIASALVGSYPDSPYLRLTYQERDSTEEVFYARSNDGWSRVNGEGTNNQLLGVFASPGVPVTALQNCTEANCRGAFVLRSVGATKPLADFSAACPKEVCSPIATAMTGAGEGFVLVRVDTHPTRAKGRAHAGERPLSFEVIRFSASKPPVRQRLGSLTEGWLSTDPLQASSSTNAYVMIHGEVGPSIFRFDGTRWKTIPLPMKGAEISALHVAADGGAYAVLESDVEHQLMRFDPAGTWSRERLPSPLVQIEGVRFGTPWALVAEGDDMVPMKRSPAGVWTKVAMPASVFTRGTKLAPTVVKVTGPDDAWFLAEYSRSEGNTHEAFGTALVRAKGANNAFRCRMPLTEDEGANERSLVDWPPAASDSCTTPYVVFGPLEPRESLDDRRVAAAREALALPGVVPEVALDTFEVDGVIYLGGRAATKEALAKLRETSLVGQLSPEVVCGSPEKVVATRTIDPKSTEPVSPKMTAMAR